MNKIFNIFGKSNIELFPQGSNEDIISRLRLNKIAIGVDDLSRALNAMGKEDPAKTLQNVKAAEAFQGAVRFIQDGERKATVAGALARAEVVPVPAMSNAIPKNAPQSSAPESTIQPQPVPAEITTEANLTEAQANVAAALLKAEQKK